MYKLKLGVFISALYGASVNKNFEYQIKKIKQLGFESVDLDITGSWQKEPFEENLYKLEPLINIIRSNDLFLNAIHMPFSGYLDISSRNEMIKNDSLELSVKVFNELDKYKPKCYIFHASNEPISNEERSKIFDNLVNSLKYLRTKTSTMICVENLPRTCLLNSTKEIIDLLSSVEGINICLDTNHFLQDKVEDAILKIGNKITTLHISDHDYIDEKHWLPGQGSIDWQKVVSSLEKIGYNGIFNYEVSSNYAYEQIKENFDNIFETYNK